MNISLPAEFVLHLFGFQISNSVLTGWLVTAVLIVGAIAVRAQFKQIPGRFQSLVEMVYLFFYDNAVNILGREDIARELFPYLITLFFFILLSNWCGLIPGFGTIGFHEIQDGQSVLVPLLRAPTSDLNTPVALALITVIYIQYLAIKYAGAKKYAGKFFNFHSPLGAFVGIMELISEFSRIISFSFRLFGNVMGGEVLISVIIYLTYTLVPFLAIIPLPFMLLEAFVGLLQAYIFCFLILIFTSLAITDHAGGGHEEEVPQLASSPSL